MDREKERDRTKAFEGLEAVSALESPESAAVKLEPLLIHPYQMIRISAAELLGQLKVHGTVTLLAAALNDRCEYVAAAAAEALVNIGTPQAFEVLRCSFLEDQVERPHYLSNAIARFGKEGFDTLVRCASSESPTLRYYAARGLGSTATEEALPILEGLATQDMGKTSFGGLVATAAKQGLKTLKRMKAKDG
jgi:HEAT repeat protein